MTKVTLKRIHIFSFLKWHLLLSLITGFFVGVMYSVFAYAISPAETKAQISGYLFWYVLGTPIFYALLTLFSYGIGALLYNALNGAFGGMKFEIEDEAEIFGEPPPPPKEW